MEIRRLFSQERLDVQKWEIWRNITSQTLDIIQLQHIYDRLSEPKESSSNILYQKED